MSSAAARKPAHEAIGDEDDPVLRALARAPMGRHDTPEEARVIADALAGGTVPGHIVTAEIAARARCEPGE